MPAIQTWIFLQQLLVKSNFLQATVLLLSPPLPTPSLPGLLCFKTWGVALSMSARLELNVGCSSVTEQSRWVIGNGGWGSYALHCVLVSVGITFFWKLCCSLGGWSEAECSCRTDCKCSSGSDMLGRWGWTKQLVSHLSMSLTSGLPGNKGKVFLCWHFLQAIVPFLHKTFLRPNEDVSSIRMPFSFFKCLRSRLSVYHKCLCNIQRQGSVSHVLNIEKEVSRGREETWYLSCIFWGSVKLQLCHSGRFSYLKWLKDACECDNAAEDLLGFRSATNWSAADWTAMGGAEL